MYIPILRWAALNLRPIRQRHVTKRAALWLALFSAMYAVPLQASEDSADTIAIIMSSNVVRDGISGTSNPQTINGAIVEFTVEVKGPAEGSSAASSFALSDDIPEHMALYVGDFHQGGAGPVAFIENDSGLDFAFSGLSSADDALEFSSNGGQTFDYIPNPDRDGFDADVTHIRIAPRGILMPAKSAEPRFTIQYRMRIK